MRIAFIADIHGNGVALRKVLASLKEKGIDKVVCLGDIRYGGPEPVECLSLIRDRADFCVLGNTDAVLAAYHNAGDDQVEPFDEVIKWTMGTLSTGDFKYISSLPLSNQIRIDDKTTVNIFHGSLSSNTEIFAFDDLAVLANQGNGRILYVGGHTHKPFISYEGYVGYLNPGRVGVYNIKQNDGSKRSLPVARYLIMDFTDQLSFEFVQLDFPLDEFKQSLIKSTIPNKEHLLKRWRL